MAPLFGGTLLFIGTYTLVDWNVFINAQGKEERMRSKSMTQAYCMQECRPDEEWEDPQ